MAWIRSQKKGSGGVIPITLVYQNGTAGTSTYTIAEDGYYLIAVTFSNAGSGSITLPDGRTAAYSGDFIINSVKGTRIAVVRLYAGDVVTMSTTVAEWLANAKVVIKLPFSVTALVDSATASDADIHYTLSTGSGTVLCVMSAWSKQLNASGLFDLTPLDVGVNGIAGVVGTNCLLRVFTCDTADFPTIFAKGYDGGGVTVAVMQ